MDRAPTSQPTERHQRLRRWLRRARRLVALLGVTAAALLLLVVLALALAPVRLALLRAGIDLVGRGLPGDLHVAEAAWPRLGELTLDGLVWTDGPDTLARIERLHVALALGELWRRDLVIKAVIVEGASADLPAIAGRLEAAAGSPAARALAADAPTPLPFFLRAGSLAPLPSLAVEQLALRRVRLVTAPEHVARLDSLNLALDLRRDRSPRLALDLRAHPLATLGATWRLRGEARADTFVLDLAPLHLAEPSRLPVPEDLPLDGRLRLPLGTVRSLLAGAAKWPSLSLEQLMITGDGGTWRLDAHLDGRRPGRLVLSSELPRAPVALLSGLAALARDTTVTPARLDTLAARWDRHGTPRVELALDLRPPAPGDPFDRAGVSARGRFRLPAPAAVASLLPPQLVVDDLGAIDGDLTASYDGASEPAALALDLDLGRTVWLDQASLSVEGDLAARASGELRLRLPGLAVTASGGGDRDTLALDLAVDLPDGSLLRRWREPALAGLDLDVQARLHMRGAWSAPHARLEVTGTATSPDVTVPAAALSATLAPDTLLVEVVLPQGLRSAALDLASLRLVFAGAATDSLRSLRGDLALEAEARPASIQLRGRLEATELTGEPLVAFTGEHLRLSLEQRHLTSAGPWLVHLDAARASVCVRDLHLAGSLGQLDLDLCARADSLEASLDVDLQILLDSLRPLLPPERRDGLPSGTLTAAGLLRAAGSPAALWAEGDLRIAVTDQPDLADLGASLVLDLAGAGAPPAFLAPTRPARRPGSARVHLTLSEGPVERVDLQVRIPWPLQGAVPDSVDLHLVADDLPLERLTPLLPAGIELTGNLASRLRVHGPLPGDLAERAERGDLDLIRDLDLALDGSLHLGDLAVLLADSTRLQLDGDLQLQGSTRRPLIDGGLRLRGDLGRLDLTASARPDSAAAELDVDLLLGSETLRPYLPPEQAALLPQGRVSVTGRLSASGPPDAPWVHAALRLGVVDQEPLATFSTTLDVLAGGRGDVPTHLRAERPGWRPQAARVRLALLDGTTELLHATVLAPLPHLQSAPDSVDARLVADRLDLARLAPLLPPGMTLTGRLDARTRLSGIAPPGRLDPELDLAGRISATSVRLQLPEGSRVAVRGELDLAGTSLAPVIRGGLSVEGGLIRLPDPPPVLLPSAGEAMLWQTTAAAPAPDDAAAGAAAGAAALAAARADTAGARSPWPKVLPDLVFNLTSPGGLWLRGQGLDIELAGDLLLLLRAGRIAVEGELQAIQGTMRQLGHVFRLERGRVVFDGSETELNPELDLVLAVRVGEYQIRIELGGTSAVPTLSFSSDPELSEADVLATLVFGKPLDELDEGQTSLLASRAAQIAAAYGAVRLQESLARGLGFDMLSLAPREGEEETTALTVGKYLSPRVLVRYEQLLRENSAFFVHLDYTFAGAFRLHTQVSQGEESGVQLKWQRDR